MKLKAPHDLTAGCDTVCDLTKCPNLEPGMTIDDKIAPLVSILCRSNYCKPVWSCEGHNLATDRRYPDVWFYATDEQIRVILKKLQTLRPKIHPSWCMHVCIINDNLVYSLRPTSGDLDQLQNDICHFIDLFRKKSSLGEMAERLV